jgi:predicted nucleic acid-binding protein
MKLSEVPSDSTVFIDANIPLTVILREQRGPLAQEFLNRVEDGEITAVTSTVVLSEVFHRSLITEVCRLLKVRSSHIALRYLKQTPEIFERLSEAWTALHTLLELPLTVYPVDRGIFVEAMDIAKKYWLLINDATHVALMTRLGIKLLATFNPDFRRVDFITCCGED